MKKIEEAFESIFLKEQKFRFVKKKWEKLTSEIVSSRILKKIR